MEEVVEEVEGEMEEEMVEEMEVEVVEEDHSYFFLLHTLHPSLFQPLQ